MTPREKRSRTDVGRESLERFSNSQTEEEREDVSLHEHTSPLVSENKTSVETN